MYQFVKTDVLVLSCRIIHIDIRYPFFFNLIKKQQYDHDIVISLTLEYITEIF